MPLPECDPNRRIKLSPVGKIALYVLRCYLIILFTLILIKFLKTI